jgi:hypothetical protein
MQDLREQLAELAHEQWAGWMRYLFDNSIEGEDGETIIPAPLVLRWKRQMNTSYADLPEAEKESDRVEADKVLHLIPLPKTLSQTTEPTTIAGNTK